MPINFSELPTSNPYALVAPGVYKAFIEEADMRSPKSDATKPDYLNLKLSLSDDSGKKVGTVYDIISESDSTVVRYKLSRFIRACGLPLTGSMELRDLAKIVKGRTIAVDITHDKKSEQPRAIVDVFSDGAYYPEAEFLDRWHMLHADTAATLDTDADFVDQMGTDTPFNAPDGGASNSSTPSNY